MSAHAEHGAHGATEWRTSTGWPTGRVGMWWFLASEIAIFGGLIACYLLFRLSHPEWGEFASHTFTPAGALNTVVLLSSSLTAVLAHAAAEKAEISKTIRYLWATVGGGVIFLLVKSYEYNHEIHEGFTPVTNLFWSFYFFMTGLHALHVIIGMSSLAYVATRVSKGKDLAGVEYAGMYWHLVDVVWIFLFPLLYIAK